MGGKHNRAHNERAAPIRAAAYGDPTTRCVTCGHTLERCGPRNDGRNRNGTPITWDAGHSDGRWSGDVLLPECSHCNRRRGAVDGNRNREPRSQRFRW